MKALIVEDEALVAKDIGEILSSNGYEVTAKVGSVEEALISIEQTVPNIALLDIKLNGAADGVDLAHILREQHQIPYLYITAHSDRITFERAKSSQPAAYLIKPFKEEEVFTAVELAIFNHLNHDRSLSTKECNQEGWRVNQLRAYILEHLSESIKLGDLAEVVKMSVYHFAHHFKDQMGIPPYQYVINLRLEQAEKLLITDLSIAQIAFETGFSSQSHFNKHFKKKHNLSPAAYRKLKR